MFTLCLIKLNLLSYSLLDMLRHYLTKGNYSLKRKKQSARVIRENSCMLKEAVTAEAAVRRSCSKYVFLKISHFAIFTGKHPC